jgi:hypothetical protein
MLILSSWMATICCDMCCYPLPLSFTFLFSSFHHLPDCSMCLSCDLWGTENNSTPLTSLMSPFLFVPVALKSSTEYTSNITQSALASYTSVILGILISDSNAFAALLIWRILLHLSISACYLVSLGNSFMTLYFSQSEKLFHCNT